jgi:gliding motility-associated-like protein
MKTPKTFGLLAVLVLCFFVIKTSAQQDPILLSTTVQNDGSVLISWDPEVAGDDDNYIIYRFEYPTPVNPQGGPHQIGIEAVNTGFFLDGAVNANQKKQIYRLNLEGSETYDSEEMQTIFLFEDIAYNECALSNTIKWTGFFDIFNPVSYIISAITDDATNFTIIETLTSSDLVQVGEISTYENASPHKTPVYEYTHEGLNPDQTYTYKVEAVYDVNGERQTSGSNLQTKGTPAYQRPDPPIINAVTVNESNEIEILGEITADGTAVINGTSIWRTNSQNSADLSFYMDLNQTSPGVINYTDESVAVDQTAYWYSVVLEDYCSFSLPENPTENAHRSIFLTANVIDNEQVELNWNAYEGWTPDRYRIFRKTTTHAYIEIGATSNLQFTDNTVTTGNISGSIIYFVQAESRDPDTGAEIISSSNRVKVGFDSPFFVPNAFRPSSVIGENQIFKPLSRFLPAGNYLFQIYDRWGKLVFESTDFNEGWDGKVNGNEAPQGVYLWRYSYNNSEGKTLEDKGTVMLIR